jgi:hypothetical protein
VCLVLVGHGDELDVGVAERDDSVCRPPAGMSPAGERRQAVGALEGGGVANEVGDRDDDVVELQPCPEAPEPAPTASRDAWKSVLSILPW